MFDDLSRSVTSCRPKEQERTARGVTRQRRGDRTRKIPILRRLRAEKLK